jgi:hypothetical protein
MIEENDFTTGTQSNMPSRGRWVEIHTVKGHRFICKIVSVTPLNFLVENQSGSLEIISFDDIHLMVGR